MLENIVNDILNLRKELQRKTQTYLCDIDYICIFDSQLNAKAKSLITYLQRNRLFEYSNLLNTLIPIESKITGEKADYDGDLMKLYKRVRKTLNLEPDDNVTENSLNEITRGLISIISGLSGISNNSGDRHAQKYKPDKRHSTLTVNSALIICKFLFETYKYQYENS